jgi:hypothetical protein
LERLRKRKRRLNQRVDLEMVDLEMVDLEMLDLERTRAN